MVTLTFCITNATESMAGNCTVEVDAQLGTEGKTQINYIADKTVVSHLFQVSIFEKRKIKQFAYGSEEHSVKLIRGLRQNIF